MTAGFLPYGRHVVDQDDIDAVVGVLKGDWLTTGPTVEAFEAALTAALGARQAVACSNGTTALHLACAALGLGPGDTLIVPAVTFLATANAARYCGAEVVFADVDPDTALMTAETLDAALIRARAEGMRPRTVSTVHLCGQVGDLVEQSRLARAQGLTIIEDGCHALGTVQHVEGQEAPVGACRFGDLTTLSFHPVKTIATAEGGAVMANDPDLALAMRRLRNHGMVREADAFTDPAQGFGPDGQPNPWYYEMPEPGWNFRLNDIQCALGISQLAKLGPFVARRRQLIARYDARLSAFGPALQPMKRHGGQDAGWHLSVALIDFAGLGRDRGGVMRALRARGIGTQVHYLPVHRQPYYRRRYGTLSLPGADRWYDRCLSLPLFPAMDEGDVDRVVDILAETLGLKP